jgi:hypothetical protein
MPVFVLAFFSSGCTVFWDAARTTIVEPAHYPTHLEHLLLYVRMHKAAEKAWRDAQANGPSYSKDYEKGFRTGFSDYLQYGGNGEPPSIPPACYWKNDSATGRDAVHEWSAGFRHGSTAARQSGIRELIVVPLSGPGVAPVHERASEIVPFESTGPKPPPVPEARTVKLATPDAQPPGCVGRLPVLEARAVQLATLDAEPPACVGRLPVPEAITVKLAPDEQPPGCVCHLPFHACCEREPLSGGMAKAYMERFLKSISFSGPVILQSQEEAPSGGASAIDGPQSPQRPELGTAGLLLTEVTVMQPPGVAELLPLGGDGSEAGANLSSRADLAPEAGNQKPLEGASGVVPAEVLVLQSTPGSEARLQNLATFESTTHDIGKLILECFLISVSPPREEVTDAVPSEHGGVGGIVAPHRSAPPEGITEPLPRRRSGRGVGENPGFQSPPAPEASSVKSATSDEEPRNSICRLRFRPRCEPEGTSEIEKLFMQRFLTTVSLEGRGVSPPQEKEPATTELLPPVVLMVP